MNDQKHKQPCRKSIWLAVEVKDGVSATSLNKNAVRSISSFDNGEPLRNTNPGRLRDKDRRLIRVRISRSQFAICEMFWQFANKFLHFF